MAEVTIPSVSSVKNVNELADQMARIQKQLQWLLQNLDHLNVKRLFTEYCDIRSKDGETIIDGPRLLMYDKQATPQLRLKAGYDDVTGDFLFELYNKDGVKTVGIDSNGNATFTGTITGSQIVGNTIKTGNDGTAHLELTGAGFRGITSDGLLSGLVFNPTSTDIVDLFLYHRGAKLVEFYDNIDSFIIRGAIGATKLGLGGNGVPTYGYGLWTFPNDDIRLSTAGKGVICKTPDGLNSYRIRVDDTGAVVTDLV